MPCRTVQIGSMRAIVCSRRQKPKRCRWCAAPGTLLCDAPVGRKTCDAPMCARHAKEIGPDRHHCLDHLQEPQGALSF